MSTTTTVPPDGATTSRSQLATTYRQVREWSERLCAPLELEDYGVQSMTEASPVKWHLAHTTWFFETFVLHQQADYQPFSAGFEVLFNSYYNLVGAQFERGMRGVLSRPTVAEVHAYRGHVDGCILSLIDSGALDEDAGLAGVVWTGLHHEQQHQELILTDLKHHFFCNPLHPVYQQQLDDGPGPSAACSWLTYAEGLRHIGHDGAGFAYDNELPRHRVFLSAFQLASRLVTNAEYIAFIEDDGYRRPALWLSEGWSAVQQHHWQAPLYWWHRADGYRHFTLGGELVVDPNAPVGHVSYYEADAFARWAQSRLPTEFEWEAVACTRPLAGNFAQDGVFRPLAAEPGAHGAPVQMFGDLWEWTASSYSAYPGYRAPTGALGEYNAKFMCNQQVLRGGSCATPVTHMRPSYRNFFHPHARWQFSGIRLARDL